MGSVRLNSKRMQSVMPQLVRSGILGGKADIDGASLANRFGVIEQLVLFLIPGCGHMECFGFLEERPDAGERRSYPNGKGEHGSRE